MQHTSASTSAKPKALANLAIEFDASRGWATAAAAAAHPHMVEW
jgi:hypothetical protein